MISALLAVCSVVPVEARQPRPLAVSLAVAREDAGFWSELLGPMVLIRESYLGRDGVPTEFAAASPENWHEDRTAKRGWRVRVWAMPNLSPNGTGSLICEVEFAERLTRGTAAVRLRRHGIVMGSGPPKLEPTPKWKRQPNMSRTEPWLRTEAWVRPRHSAIGKPPAEAVRPAANRERQ